MSRRSRSIAYFLGASIVLILVGIFIWKSWPRTNSAGVSAAQIAQTGTGQGRGRRGMNGERAIPVRVLAATVGEMPVYVTSLGTISAKNTAVVRARVEGLLQRLTFTEGQTVQAGQVLAELDARPLQVAVDQARGQLARDQAQLANAAIDLERYRGLLAKNSIAKQQVDTQAATVRQLQGTLAADRAQVSSSVLQLSFAKVVAPTSGRLGLRQIDLGNQVHPSDVNGIVTITETQPINALFAIPADHLPTLLQKFSKPTMQDSAIAIDAFDRGGKQLIAHGKLASIDNQIDSATGTIKLKAEFANSENNLFPNQFVNIRLLLDRLTNVVLIPAAAVQRGAQGAFVFVSSVNRPAAKGKAELRLVQLGQSDGDWIVALKGVNAGEYLVVDGADKLRDKSSIEIGSERPAQESASGVGQTPDAVHGARHRARSSQSSGTSDPSIGNTSSTSTAGSTNTTSTTSTSTVQNRSNVNPTSTAPNRSNVNTSTTTSTVPNHTSTSTGISPASNPHP